MLPSPKSESPCSLGLNLGQSMLSVLAKPTALTTSAAGLIDVGGMMVETAQTAY